jgi:hypothetical protein
MKMIIVISLSEMLLFLLLILYITFKSIELNNLIQNDPRVWQISDKLWDRAGQKALPGWRLFDPAVKNWIEGSPGAEKCRRRIVRAGALLIGSVMATVIIWGIWMLAGI